MGGSGFGRLELIGALHSRVGQVLSRLSVARSEGVIMNRFVEVFRHPSPVIAEMAENLLREQGIPCYVQLGSVTGVVRARPVFPGPGLGIEYIVYVPAQMQSAAVQVLEMLEQPPEEKAVSWRPAGSPRRRRLLWMYLALVLVMIITIVIVVVLK